MFGTVLSVLLMGMMPVVGVSDVDQVALQDLAIAAPIIQTESASTLLDLSRKLSASGVLVTDLGSGQRLYARSPDERRSIGSLTKLMTALIIVENHSMDEVVKVPEDIERVPGSVAHLRPGSRYTVGELLTAMLVASANDAAHTLARFHSGSVDAFVREMNDRAAALGLKNTAFRSPDGMDEPGQWSTPQDFTWLAQFVYRQEEIRRRMSMPEATIHDLAGNELKLENTHVLVREQGAVVAGKTGTTDAAGQCLLSIVREGEREFVVVLLGSRGRYADMHQVIEALATLND